MSGTPGALGVAPTTDDVLAEVAAATDGDRVGRFVLTLIESLRRHGRSRLARAELETRLEKEGLMWPALATPAAGNVGDVLIRGPRSTGELALVEAWIARGLAARLAGTPPEVRRRLCDDLVPVADHMRLLTPYDPYRMLGPFLDRETVLLAFEALTDAIVRDARALGAGRSSRLRAVITQRLESLARVLPDALRQPFEERIRSAGGDPAVPLLLDAALGRLSHALPPPPAAATPAPELAEVVEGRCERSGARSLSRLLAAVTGLSLVRGLSALVGRALLGLRRGATVRTGPEGIVIIERTWLLGRLVRDRTSAVAPGGLSVLRVERRTPLFLALSGLLGGTLGAGTGLFLLLDGIRGEYAAVLGLGLLMIGGGVALDLVALWASERLGSRASLTLQTKDGRWLRVSGIEPDRALRFAGAARELLASEA